MTTRRQATLYLQGDMLSTVESVRSRFNPVQSALIRAHVTLCREDEVADWRELESRLSAMKQICVSLEFGKVVKDGNLVYLATTGPTTSFDELRSMLLASDDSIPRPHEPHVTLVHPRNGRCDDIAFNEIESQLTEFSAVFDCVTLIQQTDGGPWHDLASYP